VRALDLVQVDDVRLVEEREVDGLLRPLGQRPHERLRDLPHIDAGQDGARQLEELQRALVGAGRCGARVAGGNQRLQRAVHVALREVQGAGQVADAARRLAAGEVLENRQAFDEGAVHRSTIRYSVPQNGSVDR
jgi:hypothetical protein